MASAKSRRDSWGEAGHASTPGPARGDHAGSKVWWFGLENHQGGRFSSLGLKTGAGAQCGWAARRVSRFGPQNLAWRPVRPDGQDGFLVWASKLGVAPGAAERLGGFGSLGLKTTKAASFSVWASKPRMALDAVEWPGGFGGLASKPSPTRVSRF